MTSGQIIGKMDTQKQLNVPLEAGADLKANDKNGKMPLDYAKSNAVGQDVIEFLEKFEPAGRTEFLQHLLTVAQE